MIFPTIPDAQLKEFEIQRICVILLFFIAWESLDTHICSGLIINLLTILFYHKLCDIHFVFNSSRFGSKNHLQTPPLYPQFCFKPSGVKKKKEMELAPPPSSPLLL